MSISTDHFYCVILAGGKGRRLWPFSREQYPKQFIDFFGTSRTQLQQTYDRFASIMPREHIFVNTNEAYVSLVREQLPELDDVHLLAEPIHRNTAPSAAWATHRILMIDPEASVVVSPSDQAVQNEEAFRHNIIEGLSLVAAQDTVLTMGVKPTRPEPGYGYIQMGDSVGDNVFKVKSFTEKPERDFAKLFLENGEFLWNTGLFLGHARVLFDCIAAQLPVMLRQFDADNCNASIECENRYIQEHFPTYPNLSLDYAVLERSENVCVMLCDFGWADLGTWHSIYEAMPHDSNDNVVIDSDVLIDDARGNVIKLPKGKFAIINGLEGFIVAEKDNVLLICRKEDSSALVRKFVNEAQLRKGEEFV
ncbi:MAG: mannose-1-phosphate guanylyltransferase [Prevotella sp.]|nr:mannose-1-phosphate guanylyltransferase [Prevotella sp.]